MRRAPTEAQKGAIRLLGIYSAGRFDIWALAGNTKASCRAHVMSELLGQKTPQAKSGVNAIRREFYSQLGIWRDGVCLAEMESEFLVVCRELAQAESEVA